MSGQAVSAVFRKSKSKGLQRLVLVALADHVNGERGDGLSWPSAVTLAKLCNASRPKVSEALKALRNMGEISDTGVRRNRALVYHLDVIFDVCEPSRCVTSGNISDDPPEKPSITSGDIELSLLVTLSVTSRNTNRKEPEKEPEEDSPLPPTGGNLLGLEPDHSIDPSPQKSNDETGIALALWLKAAGENGWQPFRTDTQAFAKRKRNIGARLQEFGLDGWRDAIAYVAANPFYNGKLDDGEKHYQMTIDLFTKPEKFENYATTWADLMPPQLADPFPLSLCGAKEWRSPDTGGDERWMPRRSLVRRLNAMEKDGQDARIITDDGNYEYRLINSVPQRVPLATIIEQHEVIHLSSAQNHRPSSTQSIPSKLIF